MGGCERSGPRVRARGMGGRDRREASAEGTVPPSRAGSWFSWFSSEEGQGQASV